MKYAEFVLRELRSGRLSREQAIQLLAYQSEARSSGEALHALVQRKTSDLKEQRFTTQLSSKDFYLRDHVVAGQSVLPGVAYLEMARAAVERSVGSGYAVAKLRDVVWVRPVVVKDVQEVHIVLIGGEAGAVEFSICSEQGEERVVHAQGVAECVSREEAAQTEPIEWDVAALRGSCESDLSPQRCYEAYESMGVSYGAAHRGLAGVHVKSAAAEKYVLARLQLPESVREGAEQYVLHPSVLDSALQGSMGLWDAQPGSVGKPVLPYALEGLQVYARTPAAGWAYVRSRGDGARGVQKLDVDVCDERGRVCVRFEGLTSRVLEGKLDGSEGSEVWLLQPVWEGQVLSAQAGSGQAVPAQAAFGPTASGQAVSGQGAGGHADDGHAVKGAAPAERWVYVDGSFAEEL